MRAGETASRSHQRTAAILRASCALHSALLCEFSGISHAFRCSPAVPILPSRGRRSSCLCTGCTLQHLGAIEAFFHRGSHLHSAGRRNRGAGAARGRAGGNRGSRRSRARGGEGERGEGGRGGGGGGEKEREGRSVRAGPRSERQSGIPPLRAFASRAPIWRTLIARPVELARPPTAPAPCAHSTAAAAFARGAAHARGVSRATRTDARPSEWPWGGARPL